jgi:hypothetical protein
MQREREEFEKSGTRVKLMTFASWRTHNGPVDWRGRHRRPRGPDPRR